MKVGVLYYLNREGHNSIFPLLLFKSVIENCGVTLCFYTKVTDVRKAKVDVLLISGFSLTKLLGQVASKTDFLKELYQSKNFPIVYLSGNDSTGPIQTDILEVVDLYLAKQLLKDLTQYLSPLKRHFFREKMMERFYFKNALKFLPVSLEEKHLSKLGLSWNLALIDWKTQTQNKFKRYFQIIWKNDAPIKLGPFKSLEIRKNPVMFRGNLFPKEHDVSRLHRLLTQRVAVKFNLGKEKTKVKNLSHEQYLAQMGETIVSLSPFGWGEICYRDFESFRAGALLFKPKMDHLITFPDLFSNQNHIEYEWDASDLSFKIEEVLKNPAQFQEIANQGRLDFEQTLSPETFGNEFVQHFLGIMTKAKENFNSRQIN